MNAIVSVTADWGIGYEGRLLIDNRADMRRFVSLTCGGLSPRDATSGEVLGTVIMGRKTFLSFPGGALKARRNIVLTRDGSFEAPGAEVVGSVGEARAAVAEEDPEKVWLIGGASVYRQLLPYCAHAYVTWHETTVPADVYFPKLDEDPSWTLLEDEPQGTTEGGIPYSYRLYGRA